VDKDLQTKNYIQIVVKVFSKNNNKYKVEKVKVKKLSHWIGGWVGPRAVLDAVMKRKIPSPRRESNPRTPIVQPITQRYTD
jgi:sulfatase maturation enzyme AslB (radical SAM superfamily)